MWQVKKFKTREMTLTFIAKHKIQYQEVFINNGYAIEYRKLIKVY